MSMLRYLSALALFVSAPAMATIDFGSGTYTTDPACADRCIISGGFEFVGSVPFDPTDLANGVLTLTGAGATLTITANHSFTADFIKYSSTADFTGLDTIIAAGSGVAGDALTPRSLVTLAPVDSSDQSFSFSFDLFGFNTVPEPATWAMLILGFGMIGLGERRKRARAVRSDSPNLA